MNTSAAPIAALLALALAGCTGTSDTSGASPRPSSSASSSATASASQRELYVCAAMPHGDNSTAPLLVDKRPAKGQGDNSTVPLLAEGRPGARVVGQIPAGDQELGCELGEPDDAYLHIVAPRSYIRSKAGVDSGWASANDVLVLANLDTREPELYTGPR